VSNFKLLYMLTSMYIVSSFEYLLSGRYSAVREDFFLKKVNSSWYLAKVQTSYLQCFDRII